MKKILRFLLILIVILLVGFLILCLTQPKVVEIEKSTIIAAPKAIVWNQMVKFDNWTNWSPWSKLDSTMTYTVEGTDGEVGSMYSWTGKISGKGTITNTEVDAGVMRYDLHFKEPWESVSTGYVKVEEEDGQVKAIWGYRAEQPFMMRGLGAIMGMRSMLEGSFEDGLSMLKEHCESGKAEMAYDIQETTFPATTFATIRKVVRFEEMDGFFGPAYGALGAAAGDMITGNAAAIYYEWDEKNGQTDCAAAFPVSGAVKGMTMVDVPESKAYTLKYTGAYSGLYGAHMAINEHIQAKGVTDVMVVEEYISMPPEQTDSNKYVTNIHYLVK